MNWVSSGHCRTSAAKVAKATNIPAWMEGDLAEVLWQLLAVVGGRVRLLGLTRCAPLSLRVCLCRRGPGLCMGNICKDLEPYYIYVIFFSCTRYPVCSFPVSRSFLGHPEIETLALSCLVNSFLLKPRNLIQG